MTDPDLIQRHPEFPFRTGRTERLTAWAGRFLRTDPLDEETEESLRQFLGLVDCYSFLESIVQGEIRYELPLHESSLLQSGGPVLEEDGERLARFELGLLGEPETPALELHDRLEDLGIKIFAAAPEAVRDEVHGFFLFEGRVGPALAIDRTRDDRRTAFVLAHLYGHLVMDVNPYRDRVCSWSRDLQRKGGDAVEQRADRFARSLLLPETQLRQTLEQIAVAVQRGESSSDAGWLLLQELYEVESHVLTQRFADLGLSSLGRMMREAGSSTIAGPAPEQSEDGLTYGGFTLPQRYLNLALACLHEQVMDERMLARFLGLTVAEARALARSSGLQ